uniref:L-Fucosyltransferase n=1 Tax=Pelusios castaneus TaxID=367368 RepID=A0A8C8SSN8_9SAUR
MWKPCLTFTKRLGTPPVLFEAMKPWFSLVSFRSFLMVCLYLLVILSISAFLQLHSQFSRVWQRNLSSNVSGQSPASSPEQSMWTVNSIGRLGNQMGEYATLYALAKVNGRQLALLFHITLPVVSSDVVQRIPWRSCGRHDWMSEEYRHIKGYSCSWTIYHHIRQEILQEFSFHDHIKEEANQYLAGLRGPRQNVTYVGIHVRRGDYIRVMPQIWKGVVADKAYLEKAMSYFRAKYQELVFVVTSNEMKWCQENINASQGDVYFSGDGKESSPGRDFALLAHCNHTIMTIGTFGIWAGYLTRGETIYLANYTLPDSPFLQLFKPEAAFLPEWIGINADLSPLLTGPSG